MVYDVRCCAVGVMVGPQNTESLSHDKRDECMIREMSAQPRPLLGRVRFRMGGGGWAPEMEMKMVAKLGAVRGGGATGWLISAGGGGGAENQIRV
jgi:hypothetical protein